MLATNDDRYCLARNSGKREARMVHRNREFTMRPGSLVLLKLDEPFFSADGGNHKRFTNVHLPAMTMRGVGPQHRSQGCPRTGAGAGRCHWHWITAIWFWNILTWSRRRGWRSARI
ncbi:MAG: hypothetical protein WDN50_19870 [Bradyrhizobium sp.]